MMAQNIPTFVFRFACLHGGVKASAVTRHICPELRMDVEEAQGILDVLVDEGFLSSPGSDGMHRITAAGRTFLTDLGVSA